MKPEELTKLFASLSAEQQEAFSKIAMKFVKASANPNVVSMLLDVPLSTLESGAGMVRIPVEELPDAVKNKRRELWAIEAREQRAKMSPEELAEYRKKDALRKQAARASKKAQSSDPSP